MDQLEGGAVADGGKSTGPRSGVLVEVVDKTVIKEWCHLHLVYVYHGFSSHGGRHGGRHCSKFASFFLDIGFAFTALVGVKRQVTNPSSQSRQSFISLPSLLMIISDFMALLIQQTSSTYGIFLIC